MGKIVGKHLKEDRLFFAVVPDADTAARICRLALLLKRVRKFEGKLIPPDRLHASLFFLCGGQGLPERIVRRASPA